MKTKNAAAPAPALMQYRKNVEAARGLLRSVSEAIDEHERTVEGFLPGAQRSFLDAGDMEDVAGRLALLLGHLRGMNGFEPGDSEEVLRSLGVLPGE